MADSKISALSALTTIAAADQLAVAHSGASNSIRGDHLPGAELSYTQRTTSVSITGTSESAGTTVLSPAAFTPDGDPIICEFFSWLVAPPSILGGELIIMLFESTTEITRLAMVQNGPVGSQIFVPVFARYRFTPSNASHTYTIKSFVTSTTGSPFIDAGSGGTGGNPPCYVRFVKV